MILITENNNCYLSLLLTLIFCGCGALPESTRDPEFITKYRDYTYCCMKVVPQSEKYSCGVACLTAAMEYWGVDCTERQLLDEYPSSSQEGYPILLLKVIAQAKGLSAFATCQDPDPKNWVMHQIEKGRPLLCSLAFPRNWYGLYRVPITGSIYRALIWWIGFRKSHYVLVFGVNKDSLLFMDPAYGFATLSWDRFMDCWEDKQYSSLLCSI